MFDGFQSPLFLLGIGAAAIPIVLHLIYRRRAPRMPFSTLRFLRQAAKNTARRKRIENWLLLLMRIAVMVLLALALSGPLLRSGAVGQRATLSGVIVLDNSFSMATEHTDAARFARAKRHAASLIDNLAANHDPVTLILTNPVDENRAPSLADSVGQVRRRVDHARIAPRRASLNAALERAQDLLAESDTPSNLLVVISDMQGVSWEEVSPPEGLSTVRNLSTVVIDCHRIDYRNLGIRDLEIRGVDLRVGREVMLHARVINTSGTPETGLQAHLFIDGEKVDTRAVEVSPGGEAGLEFRPRFTEPGVHEGRIWLESKDSLPTDDAVHFVIEIAAGRPALVVAPRRPGPPTMQDSFFLEFALDPFHTIDNGAGGEAGPAPSAIRPVRLETAEPEVVTAERLDGQACVFVVGPERLTASSREALWRYVHGGGGMVVYPGPGTEPGDLESFLAGGPGNQRGCSVKALGALGTVGGTAAWSVGAVDTNHPVLSSSTQWDIGSYFDRLGVSRLIALEPGSVDSVPAWLAPPEGSVAERRPLVVESEAGRGRVLVYATAPRPEWSNLARSELMLILSLRSVYYLAPDPARRRMLAPGEVFVVETPAERTGATLTVTGPDGVPRNVPLVEAGPVRRGRFTDTDRLGAYRYTLTSPGRERTGLFVVNPDLAESDLRALGEPDVLTRLEGLDFVRVVRTGDELTALMDDIRQGRSLAPIVFILVIALALVECFLANRIASRGQSTPETTPAPQARPAKPSS